MTVPEIWSWSMMRYGEKCGDIRIFFKIKSVKDHGVRETVYKCEICENTFTEHET